MSSTAENAGRLSEYALKKALKNYPSGIPLRLLIEEEVIPGEVVPAENTSAVSEAGGIGGVRLVMLVPEDISGISPELREFMNNIALKGLKLQGADFEILNARDFAKSFEKYPAVKFIVAFGLGIYNMLYAGQNLGTSRSLSDYRGVSMMIADQISEIMSNASKKKIFWENLKNNVLDKKIL